jgi:hypothetical protein
MLALLLQLQEEVDTIGIDGNPHNRRMLLDIARTTTHMTNLAAKDLSTRDGNGEIYDNPVFSRFVDRVISQLNGEPCREAVTVAYLISR